MVTKIEKFIKPLLRTDLPEIKPGDTVLVHQKIPSFTKKVGAKNKKETKTITHKIQVFEGVVLAKKHGKGISSTITVRKIISGIGVEKIFPLHCPTVAKIEVKSHSKVRRSKLYYLRELQGKKAKLKKAEEKTEKK